MATASGNGGVFSNGDINSGGNVGNAIPVGDTVYGGGAYKPSGGGGGDGYAAPSSGGGHGGKMRALPNIGVGVGKDNSSESLLLALETFGLVALSLGYGYDRRVSRAGGR